MNNEKMSFLFPAESKFLTDVREVVGVFCEKNKIGEGACHSLTLAANEACSNIIRHAYVAHDDKKMEISIWLDKNVIFFVAQDAGCGFDFRSIATPPLMPKEPIESGYGILLMKSLMDEVKFEECHGGGLSVTLIKKL